MTCTLEIRPVTRDELPAGAALAGTGLADNPMAVRALGGDSASRARAMGRMFLPLFRQYVSKGRIMGAFVGGELVGVCGMVAPGGCGTTVVEKLRILPSLLRSVPPARLPGFVGWVSAWEHVDLAEAHWHLGPVAVRPDLRGGGIGSALLSEFAAQMHRIGGVGYLETDTPANVSFYQRFGFAVIAERPVLSLPNWFMRRTPTAGDGAPRAVVAR